MAKALSNNIARANFESVFSSYWLIFYLLKLTSTHNSHYCARKLAAYSLVYFTAKNVQI